MLIFCTIFGCITDNCISKSKIQKRSGIFKMSLLCCSVGSYRLRLSEFIPVKINLDAVAQLFCESGLLDFPCRAIEYDRHILSQFKQAFGGACTVKQAVVAVNVKMYEIRTHFRIPDSQNSSSRMDISSSTNSIAWRHAAARWLILFFSSSLISPKVLSKPSGRKTGS